MLERFSTTMQGVLKKWQVSNILCDISFVNIATNDPPTRVPKDGEIYSTEGIR
jgi:hypothetical protein